MTVPVPVHHRTEGGIESASRFVDALQTAVQYVGTRPATGSPRYAAELELPGLRCWRLKRFPYFLFDVEQPTHVDALRLLHTRTDIPAWFAER